MPFRILSYLRHSLDFCRLPMLAFAMLFAALVLPSMVARAEAQERAWKVTKWSGAVTWTTAAGQTSTSLDGAVISPGDRLATGANGRVMMARGSDTLVMSENSTLQVPSSEVAGTTPTIIQSRGRVSYDVEPRPVQPFIVETPHLAAVVKGTQFIVSADATASSVRVSRGLVEVADFRSGGIVPIGANQEATASASGRPGLSVAGEGALPLVRQGPVRSGGAERQATAAGNANQSSSEPTSRSITPGGTAPEQAAIGGVGGPAATPAPTPEKEMSLVRRIGDKFGIYPAAWQNDRNDELFYGLLFAGFSGFTVMVFVMIRERRRLEVVKRERDHNR